MARRSLQHTVGVTWQLQEAKARFSEVFRRVLDQGPQRVSKQGGESVVIIAAADFDRATQRADQPASLVAFFRLAPKARLDLTRKRDRTRDIMW
jgi:antitoxin Phd